MEKAGIGRWAALYAHMLDIIHLEPRRRFGENLPIALRLKGQSEDFYAVFVRHLGHEAVCFCRGVKALAACRALLAADENEVLELLYGQNFYVARFDDTQSLNEQDAEILNLLMPAFHHTWRSICFRSFEPGYLPSNLSAKDVETLSELALLLFSALTDYFASRPEIDYTASQLLRREQGKKNETALLPAPPSEPPKPLECSDELLRAKTRRRPLVDAKLELDMFFIPQPVADDTEPEKTFFPRVMLLADSASGQIAAYDAFSPADDIRDKLYGIITEFLEKYGRPLVICMQDKELFQIADGFLSFLEIPHRLIPFLPAVNEFKLTLPKP